MATLNIPAVDSVKVEEKPVIVPVEAPVEAPAPTQASYAPKPPMYYMPAYWDIQPNEGSDTITAKSMVIPNDVFVGTVADFNKMLRGA